MHITDRDKKWSAMPEQNTFEVVMPKLGLIMTEAHLLEWFKQDGEWINQGEPLFTLESKKSAIDIEAPASGYVQILVPAGETVPVMTPVALIFQTAEEVSYTKSSQPEKASPEHSEVVEVSQIMKLTESFKGIRATPKARNLARKMRVTLSGVTGTGPRGMVVSSDLEVMMTDVREGKATPVARRMAADCGIALTDIQGTGPGGRITRDDVARTITQTMQMDRRIKPHQIPESPLTLPLTGLRGIIAERLTTGWRERPQVTLVTEVEATRLLEIRQQIQTGTDKKVSFNAIFVFIVAHALQEHPRVNVRLTEVGLEQLREINIGVAVDTERGLTVPVLHAVSGRKITDIDQQLNDLVARTLQGQALPEELTDGTFTITNLGGYGTDAFTPIINPPEAMILGIGRIKPMPVAIDRNIGVRDMVTLSLSFDHRLIDGAPAAQFLQTIAGLVQNPDLILNSR